MSKRVLLALHAVQLAFMLWIAFGAVYCCDADYYVRTGQALLREGLAYGDDFAGYRSYFVPLVLGLLHAIPAPAMPASGQSLPFTLSVAFTLVSFAASVHIVRREGVARYLTFAIPTLFNPFLIAQVPIPMQESVLMLFVVPILVVLLAVRQRTPYATLALATLAASVAFIVRGSMGWLALPLALFVILEMRRAPESWRAASRARLAALALAIPLILVAPQSLVMQQKLGTLDPYPTRRDFVLLQAYFGVSMFKTTTMLREGKWTQLRVLSPFDWLPREEKMTFSFYREHRGPAVLLVLGHVWAGLHYEVLTTYVRFEQFRIVNPWIVLSSFIVAYGLIGLVRAHAQDVAARRGIRPPLRRVQRTHSLRLARHDESHPMSQRCVVLCVVFNAALLHATWDIRLLH